MEPSMKVNNFLFNLEDFVNTSAMLCDAWMDLDKEFQEVINDRTEFPLNQSFDEVVAELFTWRNKVTEELKRFQNEFIINKIVEIIKTDHTDGECIDQIVSLLKDNGIIVYKDF